MELREVNKMEQEFAAEGWALYATDDPDLQIIEWDDECAARVAWALHQMLRRHALSTSGVARHGQRGVLVQRLELIELTVVVNSTANDSKLSFVGKLGTPFTKTECEQVPGAKPNRLNVMQDVGLHAARTLRAHLAPLGLSDLELKLRFGVAPGGECLLQVPNPLECAFGSTDYEAICAQLG